MKALLPEYYLSKWGVCDLDKEHLQEIRLRVGQVPMFTYKGEELSFKTSKIDFSNCGIKTFITKKDIEQIFQWLCGYGVYAYQEEMKKGYITIQGGHRVGIGGQVSFNSQGNVIGMKYINSLLIRVSHDIKGVGEALTKDLYENGRPYNILILSPPGCGKTTLLRDLIRNFSYGTTYGMGVNVSVIDEREELAAAYMGVATLDLGPRTDLILGCDKGAGMEMCLRALGPNIVAVDEIYSKTDLESIKRLKGCGCAILATHHATDFDDFSNKTFGKELLAEQIFDRFIVLSKDNGKYLVKEIVKRENLP